MYDKTLAFKLIWIFSLLLGTGGAFAQEEFILTDEELASEQAGETKIDFYGKVVDQHGDPVVGAKISVGMLHIAKPPVREERVIETDSSGCFAVHWGKGSFLVINKIQRDGYEIGPKMYQYSYRSNWGYRHIPDESNPVVFKMRKRAAEPTYLMHDARVSFVFDEERSCEKGYDIIKPYIMYSDLERGRVDDFLVAASRLDGGTQCLFTFSAGGGEDAGIVARTEFLGMAPETGYERRYELIAASHDFSNLDGQSKLYLYLRSRNQPLYSCFQVQGINVTQRFTRITGDLRTNPLGDRNLEMDEQFPGAASSHIEAMVRKACRDGVPLDVAPLKELIEAAKGTTKEESLRISREVRDLADKVEREEKRNFEIDTATLTEMYRKAKKVKN